MNQMPNKRFNLTVAYAPAGYFHSPFYRSLFTFFLSPLVNSFPIISTFPCY